MPGYQVPKLFYKHEGETIEFRADLNVFTWCTEMLVQEPERFVATYDEKGVATGGRMVLNRANIVGYFTVFGMACHPDKDWEAFTDSLPPHESISLWHKLDSMLLVAGMAGEEVNDPKGSTEPTPTPSVMDKWRCWRSTLISRLRKSQSTPTTES